MKGAEYWRSYTRAIVQSEGQMVCSDWTNGARVRTLFGSIFRFQDRIRNECGRYMELERRTGGSIHCGLLQNAMTCVLGSCVMHDINCVLCEVRAEKSEQNMRIQHVRGRAISYNSNFLVSHIYVLWVPSGRMPGLTSELTYARYVWITRNRKDTNSRY